MNEEIKKFEFGIFKVEISNKAVKVYNKNTGTMRSEQYGSFLFDISRVEKIDELEKENRKLKRMIEEGINFEDLNQK